MASSMALTKKRSAEDSALMPPPPPPVKRMKRPPKVLDEETYTSALSHIIARDFFPGLLEIETQQDFLDALDAGDEEWINEAERRVREIMATPRRPFHRSTSMTPRLKPSNTPQRTPHTLSTPLHSTTIINTPVATSDKEVGDKIDVDLNLSLSAFQAKYTSEDNESFDALIDRQNIKRAEKYAWMWNGNKLPSARQIAQAAHRQKWLASSSSSQSQALTLRPSQDLGTRPAAITTQIPDDPKNGFMFTPADLSEKHPEHKSIAQAAQDRSNAPPKSVSYESTRLPIVPSTSTSTAPPSVPASPSLSAIDRAIRGEVPSGPATGANSIALPSTGGDDTEVPRVNGWEFVDAEPTPSELGISPAPSKHPLLEELGASGSGGGKGGGFTIAEPRKRETLHHRIVERQLSSKRTNAGAGAGGGIFSSSNTPASTTRRKADTAAATPRTPGTPRASVSGNLTPAAQQLYSKLRGNGTPLRDNTSSDVWSDGGGGGGGGGGSSSDAGDGSAATPFGTAITPRKKKIKGEEKEKEKVSTSTAATPLRITRRVTYNKI